MDVTEVLQFVDQLVFEHTGKYLDDVQKSVVEGTWQGQTYEEIGEKCNRSKHHVRDVGCQLWQLLSEALEEDIKKSNFRSNLERVYIKSYDNSTIYNINNSKNNFYPTKTLNSPKKNNRKSDVNTQANLLYHDLNLAPKIINFHNRETELGNLHNWIFNQNTHLIAVLGLFGMGKTTLVKRFVDLNSQQFEVIIWRSLKFPKSLDLLLDDLLNICKQDSKAGIDDKLRQLLDFLIDKKCLIILDDCQNIFSSGQFAGHYQTEYHNYQNLFKMIAEAEHQSHFILVSQEQCSEMHCLDEELYSIKCLELSGIEDIEILKNKDLKNDDSWLDLIKLYESNPVYVKDIIILIKNIFGGEVSEFLAENSLVITKNMQTHFRQLFNRLSSIEQQLILELSKFDHPISREDLRQNLDLSSTDFMNSLQSLQQRYLLQKINEEIILFNLSTIFREYVRNCH